MIRSMCLVLAVVLLMGGISYAGKVDISGLVQIQYVDERGEDSNFAAKAVRLMAETKPTDRISLKAQIEAAKEPNLLDAMMDYSFSKAVTVRIGQFKLPFGFETQISRFDLEAVERSLVISYLWDNGVSSPYIRDIGALVMGKYKMFEYKVGAVNGVGYNYSDDPEQAGIGIFPQWGRDNNDAKDIVGRIGMGIPMLAGLGFSFYEGEWQDGQERDATSFDFYFDTGRIVFQLEYVWAKGRLAGDESQRRWQNNRYGGYYLVLGYRATPLIEPVYKVDICDPNKDTNGDRLTNLYFGLNLNFERRARFQVFYRESKIAKRFDSGALLVQASARF